MTPSLLEVTVDAPATSGKSPKDLRRALVAPLLRLRLAAHVRELGGLLKPVKMSGRQREEARLRQLVAAIEQRLSERRPRKALSVLPLHMLVLALRVASRTLHAPAHPVLQHVADLLQRRGEIGQPFNGFVSSSADETMVVRVSLLLRLLRRYGSAVDLLAWRFESDRSHGRAAYWLRQWLEEGGEKKAAALMCAEAAPLPAVACDRAPASRRRHAVVMLAMFDSDVARASLASLVHSDFAGDVIVVEDGLRPEPSFREFCDSLGVRYLKCSKWRGSAAAMNAGIMALAPTTDIVLFTHNDVLWPRKWFQFFDETWDRVLPGGRVALLNLGYLQLKRRLDSTLVDLFVTGCYNDLVWLLRAMRDVPQVVDQIQQCEVRAGEQPFGLARDPWNDWTPDLRQMTGRFSVASSFPYALWQKLGGFSEDLPYGFDLELQQAALRARQWILFLGNPPLVHLSSSDTRSLPPAEREEFTRKVRQTYESFEAKYGWHVEHFLNLYFSETTVVHYDRIVRAVNSFDFEDVDFVFDDFSARLSGTKLANCELTWCRHRHACQYV